MTRMWCTAAALFGLCPIKPLCDMIRGTINPLELVRLALSSSSLHMQVSHGTVPTAVHICSFHSITVPLRRPFGGSLAVFLSSSLLHVQHTPVGACRA